jgi:hypothetical protein
MRQKRAGLKIPSGGWNEQVIDEYQDHRQRCAIGQGLRCPPRAYVDPLASQDLDHVFAAGRRQERERSRAERIRGLALACEHDDREDAGPGLQNEHQPRNCTTLLRFWICACAFERIRARMLPKSRGIFQAMSMARNLR